MYTKISEKIYRMPVDNRLVDIIVPYEKADLIFKTFISTGGNISEDGVVDTDPFSAVACFKAVGNILLTEYDVDGNITKQGNCSMLSTSEVKDLFLIGKDCVQGFINALSSLDQKESANNQEDEKEKTQKKAKKD